MFVIEMLYLCNFQIYTRELNFTTSSLVRWVFSYRQQVCLIVTADCVHVTKCLFSYFNDNYYSEK